MADNMQASRNLVAGEPVTVADVKPILQSIGDEAMKVVRGNREGVYGPPSKNFETTAILWEAWLNARQGRVVDGKVKIDSLDVADLMSLLKLARLGNSPRHRDSRLDVMGYQLCGEQIVNGGWQ